MEIKKLDLHNQYDVFVGDGWENWLRVQIDNRAPSVEVLKSSDDVEVTPELMQFIFFKIKKNEKRGRKVHGT